jgi:hypothetical protein
MGVNFMSYQKNESDRFRSDQKDFLMKVLDGILVAYPIYGNGDMCVAYVMVGVPVEYAFHPCTVDELIELQEHDRRIFNAPWN